jgi:protein gp37
MWDWNGAGVQVEWLERIIEKMRECSQHTFQILSKRPGLYGRFKFPPNAWLGTSIAITADCHRVKELYSCSNADNLKFVSIEPIHERISLWFSKSEMDWLIVGAETGHRKGKITPDPLWITSIIQNATYEEIPLFIKHNVGWPQKIQQFPEPQSW